MAEDLLTALNAKLASHGIKLEFRDGDLWIGARSESELRQFEVEHGETIRRLRGLLQGQSPTQAQEPVAPVSNNSPPERWQTLNANNGLAAMMQHAAGEPPIPTVPVAQVAIPLPSPGRTKLLPCPRWEGIPVIDGRGHAWRAARDKARNAGEKFDTPPPYDMRPFGDSNEP